MDAGEQQLALFTDSAEIAAICSNSLMSCALLSVVFPVPFIPALLS
jgi:hypothetical protein